MANVKTLNLGADIERRINEWLTLDYDADTRAEIEALIDAGNRTELIDRFFQDLEFGTGGMRGIMQAGSNRMNLYTIRSATQGLANYIKKSGDIAPKRGVCIAFDSRRNSKEFATEAALVLCANGIIVYLFESLRPTPELSFAVRHYGAQSGIVVTASHNPKEYNGYKVYWADGGQVTPPHDKNIIAEVRAIKSQKEVKTITRAQAENSGMLVMHGRDTDTLYLNKIKSLLVNPDVIEKTSDALKIAYTPLHGTGFYIIPESLRMAGFKHIIIPEAQRNPDGNFPTVKSPNPEEPSALEMAIELAKKENADLVLASDPDADRIGLAVKDNTGAWTLLNGNQSGALLVSYITEQLRARKRLPDNALVIKTIVTSELLASIAQSAGCAVENVLTGFKWIADTIQKNDMLKKNGKPYKQFVVGGEESYGYLIGDAVRDKDAVAAATIFAELAAYCMANNKTVWQYLQELYVKHGYYREMLKSVNFMGKKGMDTMNYIMSEFRANPPKKIAGFPVVRMGDLTTDEIISLPDKKRVAAYNLPKSNVLQFWLSNGAKISVRPSGTEPKIKFYFSLSGKVASAAELSAVRKSIDATVESMLEQFSAEALAMAKKFENGAPSAKKPAAKKTAAKKKKPAKPAKKKAVKKSVVKKFAKKKTAKKTSKKKIVKKTAAKKTIAKKAKRK